MKIILFHRFTTGRLVLLDIFVWYYKGRVREWTWTKGSPFLTRRDWSLGFFGMGSQIFTFPFSLNIQTYKSFYKVLVQLEGSHLRVQVQYLGLTDAPKTCTNLYLYSLVSTLLIKMIRFIFFQKPWTWRSQNVMDQFMMICTSFY